MKKAAHSKNVPSAITASVLFHSVKAMQQLLYSASSNLFSSCDQCVPITQSDIGGVWHARVVMDYERSYIYIYSIYIYCSVACYL